MSPPALPPIEPEDEDVLRALGAKKMNIMRKLGIPRSMPYFFGSLKIAITLGPPFGVQGHFRDFF